MKSNPEDPIKSLEKPTRLAKKPSWLFRMGNRFLVLLQLTCGFALASMALSRDVYREVSNQMFSHSSPILNSYFLDFFLNREAAIVLGLLFLANLAKEFIIVSFRARVLINLSVLFFLSLLFGLVTYLIYSPIPSN
jgi:hypothetical protein